jgi:hypothetical protein
MKNMRLLLGMMAALGFVLFTGCQDMDNGNNDQETRLLIKLTDAPFPIDTIDAALVNITKVEIRKVDEGEEDDYPFVELEIEQENFNLLDLQNGITADLVDTEIEAGNYDLIRIYVDEVGLRIKEGETYDLKVPSGQQTGIKLFVEPALRVESKLTSYVLLDFNVEKSFVLKGNIYSPAGIKGFNFKPVIRAVNLTTAGTIEGMVMNSDTALENAHVLLEQVVDEDTLEITTRFTDDTGYYAMPGIPAGFYNLSATLTGFDTVAFEGVEVIEGNLTVVDFTLTKLKEEEDTTATEE